VADTGNSRLLLWDHIPSANNAAADGLIGQANFEVLGEASLNMARPVNTSEMYWSFSVTSHGDQLIAADTGNHRILFYNL